MVGGINTWRAVFGFQTPKRKLGGTIAVGLFLVTALITLVSELVYHTNPEELLWLIVLLGVSLSMLFAYWKGGLLMSWILVLGPVLGPLAYYRWSMIREGTGPVAIFLSFDGYGAASFWIPVAIVLGNCAFGVGVISRWGLNYLTAR